MDDTDKLAWRWLMVASAVLFVPLTLFGGYVSARLWQWFLVPLGLPAISLWHAIGIGLVVRWFTFQYRYDKDADEDKIPRQIHALTASILIPLIFWCLGALWHWMCLLYA